MTERYDAAPPAAGGADGFNMVWVVFGETIRDEVMEALDDCDVPFYSVWRDVLARDNEGEGTRWDDAVFPGKNWMVQFVCDDARLDDAMSALSRLLQDPFIAQSGIRLYANRAARLL
ncbi:MAG: hypothetical protein Q4A13_01115 [Fretibacterium sp.]|uniref:PG0541 family transporter-associated protein n=1 Tax=Fretibacterium sp. OH1220_COT-178 TaxID=2491047 RepID=UPI001F2A3757|nr:PG0541 family transporter-associated protein [Fretibacterium sp. OH1220_COT-178]MDO4785514.1 hypothetical protein [Fretibacterium sp.]